MSESSHTLAAGYVAAAAALLSMPLSAERGAAVAAVMERLGAFAADVAALELDDRIEVAGVFTP